MLSSLTIQNYALISQLEIDFSKGFSVLTGETGAGKSIILGALSLILGQRADVKSIKQNESKCIVEGVFDVSAYNLKPFFDEKELEYDERHCILRRELYASGKSRAFINDTPVGLNDLKELGTQLIDVHSQHQNLALSDGQFQMQVLDAIAGNKKLREQYKLDYQLYQEIRRKIQLLKESAEKATAEEDYLKFQYQQLSDAKLLPEEQDGLEAEAETLSHVEEIKTGLYQIEQILTDENKGVVLTLKEAFNTAQSLIKIFSESTGIAERLESAYLDIKDLAQEVAIRQEHIEYDPERFEIVSERLDLLYSLQQKHGVHSNSELIQLRDRFALKLQSIENMDEELVELQNKLDQSFQKLINSARLLSQSRKETAQSFEKELVRKVNVLGMLNMKFACELTVKENPDAGGIDQVNFLFSANKNTPLKPVAEIASGGEVSRLMLGVKALIAGAVALPTIIFDEIDTGVSGEVADKMANIMQELGEVMQVIVITHLPQIAAKGETHYFVYKEDVKDTTETHIRKLSPDERIREIAQMVSGEKLTEAALENAKNLLKL